MTTLLLLLAPFFQDGDPWKFEVSARPGLAWQGESRVRSMELEAIGKGGTGKGTLIEMDELGLGDGLFIPALSAQAIYRDKHRLRSRFFFASDSETSTLSRTLEYDGDLHHPGERVEASTSTLYLELGYAYLVQEDLFSLEGLDLWVGGTASYFHWEFEIETEIPGLTPPSDAASNEVITGVYVPSLDLALEYEVSPAFLLRAAATWNYGVTFRRGTSQNRHGLYHFLVGAAWRSGPWSAGVDYEHLLMNALSLEHTDETDVLNWKQSGIFASVGYSF